MSSLTDYAEGKLRNHITGETSYTMPTVYLALFTTATDDAGGGTEVAGGSYARQAASFTAGIIDTDAVFASMPATTVTHLALFDASSGGNMLLHTEATTPRTYSGGATATIAAGDLSVVFS